MLLSCQFATAQDTIPKSALLQKKNEVRVDVLATAFSRFNFTYERFLNKNFSVGLTSVFSNSKSANDDFDEGTINSFTKYEFIPFVRYNLSKSQRSFYFAELFADINGGDFREIVLVNDSSTGSSYYTIDKSTYTDIALGASVGYKYYIKDQIGIEFLVGFGSNMLNKDKSPDIISRVGLSVGYRF